MQESQELDAARIAWERARQDERIIEEEGFSVPIAIRAARDRAELRYARAVIQDWR